MLAIDYLKYDVLMNHTENATVIWALGRIRPPDLFNPTHFPKTMMVPNLKHLVIQLWMSQEN